MTDLTYRKNGLFMIKIPTPSDIIATRKSLGLSQSAAAAVVHADMRSWQRWEAGDRKMHLAFWTLFLLKTGAES